MRDRVERYIPGESLVAYEAWATGRVGRAVLPTPLHVLVGAFIGADTAVRSLDEPDEPDEDADDDDDEDDDDTDDDGDDGGDDE